MTTVRTARPEDADDLAELMTDLGYPVPAKELWSRIEKMPAITYQTLVAVVENKVVGFIGLLTLPVYEHARPIGWILALSVSSKHRRQGIGRQLLVAAEDFYQQNHVTDVRLHSGLQRGEAHEFYEKAGFQKSGYRFKKVL